MAACVLRRVAILSVILLGLLIACGDDGSPASVTPAQGASDNADAAPGQTDGSAGSGSAAAAGDDADDSTQASPQQASTGPDRCPLSVGDVGGVLGVPMIETSCTFFPADGGTSPSAIFVRQVPFACDAEIVADVGYEQTFDELGIEAYLQPETAFGAQLLVCTEAPFEVVADVPGDRDASIAASAALAQIVLDYGG